MTVDLRGILGDVEYQPNCEEPIQFNEPIHAGCVEFIDAEGGVSISSTLS